MPTRTVLAVTPGPASIVLPSLTIYLIPVLFLRYISFQVMNSGRSTITVLGFDDNGNAVGIPREEQIHTGI
ncbi:MAG: hypothetical protein ACREBA_06275, partial [Nitrosotalea sp.]